GEAAAGGRVIPGGAVFLAPTGHVLGPGGPHALVGRLEVEALGVLLGGARRHVAQDEWDSQQKTEDEAQRAPRRAIPLERATRALKQVIVFPTLAGPSHPQGRLRARVIVRSPSFHYFLLLPSGRRDVVRPAVFEGTIEEGH